MNISGILIPVFLAIGLAFNALGVIGILRFPDVYTRLHAETKMTTFGTIFICLAGIVYCISEYLTMADNRFIDLAANIIIVLIALAFTNSVGSHAIARAAYKSGQKPNPSVVDRLSEVSDDS
ncbi:monovalent cation/H(+) antiporter subunit G [Methanoplanus limicola]|uniref:Monovalent cation/proton antiporter, MnhG/PhaG subunit n=1 Tax=Methanoplanus limicola DSM 2279 TaxID=937775 RepID=H1Z3R5_9EURY|nr:monovalent cation/H(+) antiporter subunit G [Methanoplanus limicola]EHQ35664.1 monovalent cation/proton antiporter, MnhG/PhaG subunit [Methanoplanus limicola DSM 2279]